MIVIKCTGILIRCPGESIRRAGKGDEVKSSDEFYRCLVIRGTQVS